MPLSPGDTVILCAIDFPSLTVTCSSGLAQYFGRDWYRKKHCKASISEKPIIVLVSDNLNSSSTRPSGKGWQKLDTYWNLAPRTLPRSRQILDIITAVLSWSTRQASMEPGNLMGSICGKLFNGRKHCKSVASITVVVVAAFIAPQFF
jgi:hypothetical protein